VIKLVKNDLDPGLVGVLCKTMNLVIHNHVFTRRVVA